MSKARNERPSRNLQTNQTWAVSAQVPRGLGEIRRNEGQ